jgi:hypothetical protein
LHNIQYLQWRQGKIIKNGIPFAAPDTKDSQEYLYEVYSQLKPDYPKFFKMDILSKLAFLAVEILNPDFSRISKDRTAVVLSTNQGCLDVDKKFEQSRATFASPALFVYTLPNIMLGEIAIRHKLKGAQMCLIESSAQADLLYFYVSDLFEKRHTEACICGHINATENNLEAVLAWVTPEINSESAFGFCLENLNRIFAQS